MVSLRGLLCIASAAVVAVAQTPKIAFSSVPSVAVVGQTYNITWGGGDGFTPVTLTLRKGDPNSLSTIGVIADRIEGYSYPWNVSALLATGDDYALQITQGQSDINYSGQFSIVGGTGSVTISYSGLTTTTANSSSTLTDTTITGGISMGTGTPMTRNNTFVTPTPTSMTTDSSGSETTPATSSTSNAANTMGSSAALVMGLFGAVMFLQ